MLLAAIALPAFAARRLTVEQLQQALSGAHGKPDAKLAQQLSAMELSERLSAANVSRLEPMLPGPESRRAFVVLADSSAFLDLPAAEIPSTPAPDLAAQRKIIALTVEYATTRVHLLPNLFATRETIRFEDVPAGQRADSSAIPYQPLHAVGRFSDTVLFRDGQEVIDAPAKSNKTPSRSIGLTTSGEFGSILGTVLVDAAHGKLAWSHWEQAADGPIAVFHFSIAKEKSHYQVAFCCLPGDAGHGAVQKYSGYHGELAVDPSNGNIRRLTLMADLRGDEKIARADILVEYGPIELGGRTYICPVKSISISLAPVLTLKSQGMGGEYFAPEAARTNQNIALQTLLNDVVFDQYHLFGSEIRVVTAGKVEQKSTSNADADGAVLPLQKLEQTKAETIAPARPVESVAAIAPVTGRLQGTQLAIPEIVMANTATLPGNADSQSSEFTLSVTTRSVDVGVVVADKKGHPVANLKPEDFEVYDNGRKQPLRFFSQTGTATPDNSSATVVHPDGGLAQGAFSNHRSDLAGVQLTPAALPALTVLFIDANSLAWSDLTYARTQMLAFLQKLSPGDRVALYIQGSTGLQILAEATSDHAMVASKLSEWMPRAQDLARAQEMEQRNRRQFDEVLHPTDLGYANGNGAKAWSSETIIDPKLREQGSDPAREARTNLTGVARHLAAIAGHKNLIWIASDNALADWTDRAAGSDKGIKPSAALLLGLQEQLNDAHVSIYPLDASQLETMAIDPSLKNRNVELTKSISQPQRPQMGAAPSGRAADEMQQNMHPIATPIQKLAEATGGRVFARSGDIATNLSGVVDDGRESYLLGFTPDTAADDKYHQLSVKLTGRSGMTLRYRSGYLYAKDAATLKERFRQAIWQPLDMNEIVLSAQPAAVYTGATIKLNITLKDLAMKQQNQRWSDKLDIFIVRTRSDGLHAEITGRTMALALLPETYQDLLEKGVPFDQQVERSLDVSSLRIIVVDENSGRMGSITLPASAFGTTP